MAAVAQARHAARVRRRAYQLMYRSGLDDVIHAVSKVRCPRVRAFTLVLWILIGMSTRVGLYCCHQQQTRPCQSGRLFTLPCTLAVIACFEPPLGASTQVVDNDGLMVREDRPMHADVGVRERVTALLQCYSPPWLQLGLETVLGEESAKQANPAALRRLIAEVRPRVSRD